MTKELAKIADRMAAEHRRYNSLAPRRALLLDQCDIATGGKLDDVQLGLLYRMVRERLSRPAVTLKTSRARAWGKGWYRYPHSTV